MKKQAQVNSEAAILAGAATAAQLAMQGLAMNEGDEGAGMAFALTTLLVGSVFISSTMTTPEDERLNFVIERLTELWGPISKLAEETP